MFADRGDVGSRAVASHHREGVFTSPDCISLHLVRRTATSHSRDRLRKKSAAHFNKSGATRPDKMWACRPTFGGSCSRFSPPTGCTTIVPLNVHPDDDDTTFANQGLQRVFVPSIGSTMRRGSCVPHALEHVGAGLLVS